jgi:hypothetical protein
MKGWDVTRKREGSSGKRTDGKVGNEYKASETSGRNRRGGCISGGIGTYSIAAQTINSFQNMSERACAGRSSISRCGYVRCRVGVGDRRSPTLVALQVLYVSLATYLAEKLYVDIRHINGCCVISKKLHISPPLV